MQTAGLRRQATLRKAIAVLEALLSGPTLFSYRRRLLLARPTIIRMASRTQQKQAARERRLEQERVRTEKARRDRRLRMLAGLVLGAAAVIAVAIAVSSGGSSKAPAPGSQSARTAAATVNSTLTGIPQSGVRLGSPTAHVTMTEFGDLQCPICRAFALGPEQQLISNEVRAGKVQIVYRSLSTATSNGPNPGIFPTQQAAAYAAGAQKLAWNYILVFYHEQGTEDTNYVTTSYLDGIARQVTGLNFATWSSDRQSPNFTKQVTNDEAAASSLGLNSTPSLIFKGPKGQTQPIRGALTYAGLQEAIKSVS